MNLKAKIWRISKIFTVKPLARNWIFVNIETFHVEFVITSRKLWRRLFYESETQILTNFKDFLHWNFLLWWWIFAKMKVVIPSTPCRDKKMFFSTTHDEFCISGHERTYFKRASSEQRALKLIFFGFRCPNEMIFGLGQP